MRSCSDGQVLEHADAAIPGKRLLVISPHADDAELGCGGYMHRTAAAGGAVLNVVVAVGDVHFAHLGRVVTRAERIAELDRSMAVLGAERRVLFSEGDRYLDTLPLADLVTALEVTISGFQPTEILIPLPSSHQDHEATFRACVAACRPSSLTRCVQLIAAYEYSATSWGAGSAADAGRGGLYAEIGVGGLQAKLQALRCYRTQIRDDLHCGSIDAARARAKMRGLESNLDHAELFHVMRLIVRS
jgi:N-acetylglucosamine malate deacetylase 1